MQPQGTFGPRLRQERERRQISLDSIAANTKISQSLLEGLERDDVSKWPSGIFRRSFVRSYAQAIGLDAEEIVKEFAERFPDPADPPPQSSVAEIAAPTPVVEQPIRPMRTAPVAASDAASDHVELVFRVSVPRGLVNWLSWLTSRVAVLRRQDT